MQIPEDPVSAPKILSLESTIKSRSPQKRSELRKVLAIVASLSLFAGSPRPAACQEVLALRPGPPDRLGALISADFNLDGRLDLLVANFEAGDLSLFQESASGAYVERNPSPFIVLNGPSYIATADLNADNRMDAVIVDRLAGGISVRISDAALVLKATANLLIGSSPQEVAVADFTGNGKLDLAITGEASNLIYLFSGKGDGTFTFLRTVEARSSAQRSASLDVNPYGIAAADFNRDGRMDLAVSQRSTDLVAILRGNGNGTFQSPVTLPVGTHPTHIVAARFNDDQAPGPGDDFVDLAVLLEADPTGTPAPFPGGAAILLGNGDGTFTSAPSLSVATTDVPVAMAAGRIGLGAAGFDDLTLVNFESQTLLLYPATGNGGFGPPATLGTGSSLRGPKAVALMDWDGNGVVDRLAVSNSGSYSLTFFDGGGVTPFTENPASPITATLDPVDLSAGDLDSVFGTDLAVLSTGDIRRSRPSLPWATGFSSSVAPHPFPRVRTPRPLSWGTSAATSPWIQRWLWETLMVRRGRGHRRDSRS